MNKKDCPRQKNIVIRVNDKEHQSIEANAQKSGLTISEYGRQLMLHGNVLVREQTKMQKGPLESDRRTIIGLASNLNQLTRYAHQSKSLPQIERLLSELESIISNF